MFYIIQQTATVLVLIVLSAVCWRQHQQIMRLNAKVARLQSESKELRPVHMHYSMAPPGPIMPDMGLLIDGLERGRN